MRCLALHLPDGPAEHAGAPFLAAREGGREVVRATTAAARAAGLRPGQPLAEARAIAPHLAPAIEDAAGFAAHLHALARRLTRFTPHAAPDPPDGLLADITGCAHLFGGEAALLEAARALLAGAGHAAHAAIADHPATAAALARAGGGIAPPRRTAEATDALPIAAARLPDPAPALLRRLGLATLGAVRAQPRAALAKRLGAAAMARLDAIAGLRAEPISPLPPAPDFSARLTALRPLLTAEAIAAGLERLLATLAARLEAAGQGATALTLTATREDRSAQTLRLGLALPSRDPRHLARLFAERLGSLEPRLGFETLALAAEATAPLSAAQPGLTPSPAEQRAELARLLDRLRLRTRVWRPAPRASHWPERAVRRADPLAPVSTPEGWAAAPRPTRLFRRPVPIGALAALPDAPPARLTIRGIARRVLRAEGPERIAPEWWDGEAGEGRDYYRVEIEGGARLWVFRTGRDARWFWHGSGV